CEVPFMPREGRPVYCQECFSRRKSNGPFTASVNNRPKELMSAKTVQINKQQISEKTKPVTKKKITATKKAAAKKSKKK
ncbi:MAG: hypothetical protein PHV55_09055, partial [Candidatus Omnitrophica bacterium]|nr:hypothetical protein [Candidatus Omnitrophota bacterium]